MTQATAGVKKPYLMYGAEVSLYSGKTRAYLRYKDIPYEERLATLEVYRQIIVPNIGRRIIPVVCTPEGEYLQDTTAIIDALEPRFPQAPVYPATPAQRLVALLLEVFGDEWLVMPAMHYRWQRKRQNLRFILGEFGGMLRPQAPNWSSRSSACCRPACSAASTRNISASAGPCTLRSSAPTRVFSTSSTPIWRTTRSCSAAAPASATSV